MTLRELVANEINDLMKHYHNDELAMVNAGNEAQRLMGMLRNADKNPPIVGYDAAGHRWEEFTTLESAEAWQLETAHPEEGRSGFRSIHVLGDEGRAFAVAVDDIREIPAPTVPPEDQYIIRVGEGLLREALWRHDIWIPKDTRIVNCCFETPDNSIALVIEKVPDATT